MPQTDGRFSACQVLCAHSDGGYEVIALDWIGDAMPTLDALEGVSVLILNHHSWEASPQRLIVDPVPPPEFVPIGVREPLAAFTDEARSYGSWLGLSDRLLQQHWWDTVVPASEAKAYKDAKRNRGQRVTFSLGGTTHEAGRAMSSARIGPGLALPVPPAAPLDWSVLDAFGMLSAIEYAGTDTAVVDYIASRVLLRELHWSAHGCTQIDLSRCGLDKLVVEVGGGPLSLHLPDDLRRLEFRGYQGQAVAVHHATRGRGLHLSLHDLASPNPMPAITGLDALTALSLMSPPELTIGALGYSNLERLTVNLKGGQVHDLEAVESLVHLQRLRITECYAMEPERFPEAAVLPKLESVEFVTLRKSHAAVLKKRLKGIPHVDLRGAKTDAWLAANADNPFNNWVDDNARLAKAACKIYRQSYGRVSKLAADDRDGYHREMVEFVRAFNALGAKHRLETIEREHIFSAFHTLADASPVEATDAELAAWFDEDREF